MELQQNYLMFVYSVFSIFFFLLVLSKLKPKNNEKVLPSPRSLPIIGHLHLVRTPVHTFLQKLFYTYGPIFTLQLGHIPVLVVSSPRILEECFSKNDIVFANRPISLSTKYFGSNSTAVAFGPYGAHWRNLRRSLSVNMMSTSRLNSYYYVRKEEQCQLVKNLYDGSSLSYRRVELGPRLAELAFNGVMRMATGKRYLGADLENKEEASEFIKTLNDMSELINISGAYQFIKFLQWIDFQGIEKRMKSVSKRIDMFLQKILDVIRSEKKLAAAGRTEFKENKTLVHEMLALQESEPKSYTDDDIKGQILAVLFAGTDSSSTLIEWGMALLLNHPEILEKARAEIDKNIGHDELVDELNVSKVPYLQCIVNETYRLFPVLPLMVPHMSSEDCIVDGYLIRRGTMLLPNVWALHRDPNVWEDPTSFRPERFEGNTKIDPYSFAPFGMGRRQCPGSGLGNRVVGVTLGSLIQCFEWKRMNDELIDLSEIGKGLIIPMKKPFDAMCKPRPEMIPILSKLS